MKHTSNCNEDFCTCNDGAIRLFLPISPGSSAVSLTIPANGSVTVAVGDILLTGVDTLALAAGTRCSYSNFSQASTVNPIFGTIYYPSTLATPPATNPSLASFSASLGLGPYTGTGTTVALTITNLSGATVNVPVSVYGTYPLVFIKNTGPHGGNCCGNGSSRPAIFFQTTDAPSLLSPVGTLQVSSIFTAADVAALVVNPCFGGFNPYFNGFSNQVSNQISRCNFGRRFAVYAITGPTEVGVASAPSTRAAAFVGFVGVFATAAGPTVSVSAITENGCNLLIPSNAILVEVLEDCKDNIPVIDIFQFGSEPLPTAV